LKVGAKLKLGPAIVSGFSSNNKCARITLDCGPKLGGYQGRVVLRLSQPPAAPISFRAFSRAGTVKVFLVGTTGPPPSMPRCLGTRGAHVTATLESPDITYVLVVFPPRGATSFRLTASRAGRPIGVAIIAVGPRP
jgi:hypothetical protein